MCMYVCRSKFCFLLLFLPLCLDVALCIYVCMNIEILFLYIFFSFLSLALSGGLDFPVAAAALFLFDLRGFTFSPLQ